MTINVSVEELREFENKFGTWCDQRSLVAVELYIKSQGGLGSPFMVMGRNMKQIGEEIRGGLDEWDKTHPEPKLIPSV